MRKWAELSITCRFHEHAVSHELPATALSRSGIVANAAQIETYYCAMLVPSTFPYRTGGRGERKQQYGGH